MSTMAKNNKHSYINTYRCCYLSGNRDGHSLTRVQAIEAIPIYKEGNPLRITKFHARNVSNIHRKTLLECAMLYEKLGNGKSVERKTTLRQFAECWEKLDRLEWEVKNRKAKGGLV